MALPDVAQRRAPSTTSRSVEMGPALRDLPGCYPQGGIESLPSPLPRIPAPTPEDMSVASVEAVPGASR